MAEEPIKQTILIIEDDLPALTALSDKLTREGFDILVAKDGEEGLMMAEKNHPDLILLDILMPKMDGLTLMKKLRAEAKWGKDVPVILLTNLSQNEEKIDKTIGEDKHLSYMVKTDWSMSDVVARVREGLSGR